MSAIAAELRLAATELAANDPDEFKAGPIGLLLLLLMGIAIVFLVRSMTKHLRKVPATFDPDRKDRPTERPDDDRGPTTS